MIDKDKDLKESLEEKAQVDGYVDPSNSALAAIALGLFRIAEAIEYAADQSFAIDERSLGVREVKDES